MKISQKQYSIIVVFEFLNNGISFTKKATKGVAPTSIIMKA